MNNADHIAAIDRYIRQEMNPEEAKAFEKKLMSDELLMKAYQEILHAQKAIRSRVLREKLAFLKGVEKEHRDHSPAKNLKNNIGKIGLLIAIILILLGLLFYGLGHINKKETPSVGDQLYADHFEPLMHGETVRGSDIDKSNDKIRAYELYSANRYEESSRLLESLFTQQGDTISALYAAISYMEIDSLKRADHLLTAVSKGNVPVQDAVDWYRLLWYLKSGALDEAHVQATSLSQGHHYKRDEAKLIFEYLNSINLNENEKNE